MIDHWKVTSVVSFFGSLFTYLLGIDNPELLFILICIASVDTVLGSALAMKERRFNAEGMKKMIYKVILYGSFIIMFNLANLTLTNLSSFQSSLLGTFSLLFLIVREGKSVNEHLAKASLSLPFNPFARIERFLNQFGEEYNKVDQQK